ncbi:PH domain-containing protein [Henriciella litoralis]|uniref:PH domain-containing protein n=1 Tax=Henriciella litoralis TaxID=568102 RepID=UPI000A008AC0|nr:PH domain-containing protein [Henriciella litoralis]
MSYIHDHLHKGEQVLAWGKFHWLWHARAWAALILLGWLIVGLVYFIYEMIRKKTTEFAVTNRAIVMKTGFIATHVDQLSLEAIESANLNQGIFGRIFNFGDLDIEGRGEGEVEFPTMAHPAAFLSAINEARMQNDRASVDRLADDLAEKEVHT